MPCARRRYSILAARGESQPAFDREASPWGSNAASRLGFFAQKPEYARYSGSSAHRQTGASLVARGPGLRAPGAAADFHHGLLARLELGPGERADRVVRILESPGKQGRGEGTQVPQGFNRGIAHVEIGRIELFRQ